MEMHEKVKMLQAIYTGALADCVMRLGNEGVLEKVTRQKRAEQLVSGKARATQLGFARKEEVFTQLSELMGCANWTIHANEDGTGFTATASLCMLCVMAKRMGTQSPCHIYCLDPMEGMVRGLDDQADFSLAGTLFDGEECRVVVTTNGGVT